MRKILAILFVCLALATAVLGCSSGKGKVKIDAEMGVSAIAALADSHIKGYMDSMEALALTEEVKSGQWEEMEPLLRKVDDAGTGGTVWFVQPDGSYYTVELGRTDQNLSDREYFPGLMAGNEVVGPLVVSKATGKKSVIAAVPVRRGSAVIGAVGSSIFLDDLSLTLAAEIELPDDLVFWATNQEGEIALHSDTTLIMDEEAKLPNSDASETSALTGWRFGLAWQD
ncbi:MAG: hypothetical protein FJ020_02550 [Chloroflexi bacterium]|nr:hypothetical protein [Chloroflexota bacterium]